MEAKIDARLILEAQGAPKEKIEESLKRLIEELEKQDGCKVYDKKFQETTEPEPGFFSLLVDVGCKFKDFENLFSIVMNFGPSAVVINEPEKLQVGAGELQNALGDMTAILHTFAQENGFLRLQQRELVAKLREMGAFEESGSGASEDGNAPAHNNDVK
jgi:hypothetical protein